MHPSNPFAAGAVEPELVRACRLYVLIRDAYLSSPGEATAELWALEELRVAVCADMAGHTPGHAPRDPSGAAPYGGVRLVSALHDHLGERSAQLDETARWRVLVAAMTSTWPPAGCGWAARPERLFTELAHRLGLDTDLSAVTLLQRRHRAARGALIAASSRRGLSRPVADVPDAVDAVAHMLADVLGVGRADALAGALVLLDGGAAHGPGAGLGPAVVLDPLQAVAGPAVQYRVGTALGRVDPDSLVHHLAGVDVLCTVDPECTPRVLSALGALLIDLAETNAADPDELARLQASRRAVQALIRRIQLDRRRPWAERVAAFVARATDARAARPTRPSPTSRRAPDPARGAGDGTHHPPAGRDRPVV